MHRTRTVVDGRRTVRAPSGLALAALAGALAALPAASAEYAFKQWKIVVDGRVSVSSGGTGLASLGHWQWKPGDAEERDGALAFAGTIGEAQIASEYRYAEGTLAASFRITKDGAPARGELMLNFAGGDLAGTTVIMDDEAVAIPAHHAGHEFKHARRYTFFDGTPAKRMKFELTTCRFANLRDFRDRPGRDDMQLFIIADDDGRIAFRLDLTASADAGRAERFPGERFAWQDDLHLDDPLGRANRVANPGFEADLASWGWGVTNVTDPPGREVWAIDETVARTGKRSARYTVPRGFHPRMLCTEPIVVEPNRPHTISFYARTDRPGASVNCFVQMANWGDFPVIQRVKVGEEWQRFVFTFVPKVLLFRVCLGDLWWANADEQVDGAHVWFDDVQVEPGDRAGEFSMKPLAAWSDTGTKNQVLAVSAAGAVAVTVCNTTGERARVSADVTVSDWNRRRLVAESFVRDLPPWGRATTSIDAAKIGARGLVRVAIDVRSGGARDTFYGRALVYQPVADAGRVRYAQHIEQPTMDDVRTYGPLGVSGSLAFGPLADPALAAEFARADWLHVFGTTYGRDCPVKLFHEQMTDDAWARYDRWLGAEIGRHPAPKYWKTLNEPNCGGYTWTPADNVRGVALMRRHIKATNPDALVLSPDPYNASRQGQAWLEEFFKVGGDRLVDVVAIHTYRARPESPDLDVDIQQLVKLKAAYGLASAPIMFTEGEGYPSYSIPEIGMSALGGFWEWRLDILTADVGRSELVAGALMARTLLTCLKHADQVSYYLTWRHDAISNQPLATLATVNNLMALARHAAFRREYLIGDQTRTYVFELPDRRSLAALWSHDLKIDRGDAPPVGARVALGQGAWTILDVMGNPAPVETAGDERRFGVSGFPVYIIGEPGSLPRLCAALERSSIGEGGIRSVDMPVRLAGASRATVAVENRLPGQVSGTLSVGVDGAQAATRQLALAARATETIEVALGAPTETVNETAIATTFAQPDGNRVSSSVTFRWLVVPRLARTVAIDGDASDWAGHASLRLAGTRALTLTRSGDACRGDDDLSATCRFGWRDDGLYACVSVRDDVHLQKHPIDSSWRGDSLQVYIDLGADGRDRPGTSYDTNDQSIWVADVGGTPAVFRDYTPEWQVGFVKHGPVESARCAIVRAGGVTTYELFLPSREVFPLAMKPGTTFGFALLVNDADAEGERRQALTTTPPGTEPHMRPDLWPAAVLVAPAGDDAAPAAPAARVPDAPAAATASAPRPAAGAQAPAAADPRPPQAAPARGWSTTAIVATSACAVAVLAAILVFCGRGARRRR